MGFLAARALVAQRGSKDRLWRKFLRLTISGMLLSLLLGRGVAVSYNGCMVRKLGCLFLGLLIACMAQRKEFEQPAMHAARGTRGGIACGSEYAAEAGMRLYFHGGNAVDAGIATMFGVGCGIFALRSWRRGGHPGPDG